MAHLLVKHANGNADKHVLGRLRTTIGRSARADLCIPDAFASRLHAEVRQEGDAFWLVDLGSANGTRLNNVPVAGTVPLASGAEIQIGETRIEFESDAKPALNISSTLITDGTQSLDPSKTISFMGRRNPTTEILDSSLGAAMSTRTDLLGLISKVGRYR